MSNALVIVESPAKVKTISKILGSGYTVRPTLGHVIDLSKGRGGGDIGVDIEDGFKPRYEVIPDKKDKIKAILDSARTADVVYVASDDDREGEAIAFHIADQLKSLNKPLKRITFNEITKKAIIDAVTHPKEFNKNLYDAQQARRVLDRIVGFMVSPYISRKLGDKLSAGRVQSVVLRMIVDREREIDEFKPEVFWNLSATFIKDDAPKDSFVSKFPRRIDKEDEVKKVKSDLDGSTFKVSDLQTKKNIRNAPAPLTTATMLQEASIKLKISADRSTKAAQALYEAGYVTYIRTDSTRNSPESIVDVRGYITKEGFEIPSKPNEYKNTDAAQDAHEAIRPTDINAHPSKIALDGDQVKIYELVWRFFVASQMKPAVFDVVKVSIQASSGHVLVSEGKILREEGWMAMAKPFVKKEKDVILPQLFVGDSLTLVPPKVKSEKSQTKPSPRYTEASIIAELKRRDIGRPSTYNSILARIATRKYVKNTSKGFLPTELGKQVTKDLCDNFTFMDYMYTADMEKKLDRIAEGKIDYLGMMSEFWAGFKMEFEKARGSQGMKTNIPCPECGEETVVRKSKYGYFAGCIKYKAGCKGIVNISMEDGKPVLKSQKSKIHEDVKCPECGSGMVPRPDGRFGPFYSCSKYPQCKGKRKIPFGKKCPKCGNDLYATLMRDTMKLACMGYPNCKHVEDVPEGANVNWIDPATVTPPIYSKKVEKVLKS
jgi:DNA topoisomerase I